jgi:hypothetical protein
MTLAASRRSGRRRLKATATIHASGRQSHSCAHHFGKNIQHSRPTAIGLHTLRMSREPTSCTCGHSLGRERSHNKEHKLFFLTPDWKIMVLDYGVSSNSFVPGKPHVWSPKSLAGSAAIILTTWRLMASALRPF